MSPAPIIVQGHAMDLLGQLGVRPAVVCTDPPYAFGGDGDEHAISATVATVLRESAMRLQRGGWFVVMCAASLRSEDYMRESIRGCGLTPVRRGTWAKPTSRTKVKTTGWDWASVSVLVFRKGRAKPVDLRASRLLDWILCEPDRIGRRAAVPLEVADWMVRPFCIPGGLALDPFAGSGRLLAAAAAGGMRAVGFEKKPPMNDQAAAEVVSELPLELVGGP